MNLRPRMKLPDISRYLLNHIQFQFHLREIHFPDTHVYGPPLKQNSLSCHYPLPRSYLQSSKPKKIKITVLVKQPPTTLVSTNVQKFLVDIKEGYLTQIKETGTMNGCNERTSRYFSPPPPHRDSKKGLRHKVPRH